MRSFASQLIRPSIPVRGGVRSHPRSKETGPEIPVAVTYDRSAELLRFAEVFENPDIALARATLFPRVGPGKAARAAMDAVRARLDDDVVEKLRNYTPTLPEAEILVIRAFVEDAVALALPLTAYSVETLLRPVMHFVYWAVFVVGCDLNAAIVFDRDLVETYVRETLPKKLAPGTRRNYRAWIFRVAEVVNPDKNPRQPMPLNVKSMAAPYTEHEIAALDRWAAGQSTPYRRSNAATLVALGAGAGLSSIEIAHLKRSAVAVGVDGTVQLHIGGVAHKQRLVTVSGEFEQILATQVETLDDDVFVFQPRRSRTENDVVSAFVAHTHVPKGTPHVTTQRLRNTWMVTQLTNRVDVLTLMKAAGVVSLESFSRLAQFVPGLTADQSAAQLRGTL